VITGRDDLARGQPALTATASSARPALVHAGDIRIVMSGRGDVIDVGL